MANKVNDEPDANVVDKPTQTSTKSSTNSKKSQEKDSKLNRYRRTVLAVALAIILCIGFGFLGGWLENNSTANTSELSGPVIAPQEQKAITNQSQLISAIAKTVGQSVVSINVTSQTASPNDGLGGLFGFDFGGGSTTQQDAGTGIILNTSGLIITNHHVIPSGTTSVSVTLSDGTTFNDVKVVGTTNTNSNLDIAFLQIQNLNGKKLVPATLGDSSQMQVGDAVVAIGNALGQFQNTVTSGIISGHGRSVTASDESGASSENLTDLFQTDAAINPGNSGGPLVNMSGEVIGINTAIAGSAQNIGFAIPINDVKGLISSVESSGKLQQPYLGVYYIPLTKDYAYVYNLPVSNGAYIAPEQQSGHPGVVAGSPAAQAGLKEKDIITKVNGTSVNQNHSLVSLLDDHQPGDTVTLTVIRGNKTLNIKVTLGTQPSN